MGQGMSSIKRLSALLTYFQDGNLGLVLTLTENISRHTIINLSKRFISLPILTISQFPQVQLSPDETVDLCQELIDDGSIEARIESSTTSQELALRFVEPESTEKQLLQRIQHQIRLINKLSDTVSLTNAKILTSKDYAKAYHDRMQEEAETKEKQQQQGGGENGLDDVPMLDGDDEDLMDETMGMDES
jgi:hypothetical protein